MRTVRLFGTPEYLSTVRAPLLTAVSIIFHFVTCRLFFDDWRYSFEIIENVRLQTKNGYCQRE